MNYSQYSVAEQSSNFIYKVYAWMSAALAITAGTAYYVASSPALFQMLMGNSAVMIGLIIAQFALVLVLSFLLMRMNFITALASFIVYSVLVGITLSAIFYVYTAGSIYVTFAVTAGTFGVMCVYGYFTKSDLTSIGNLALMALIGMIIGSLVNMFLRSAAFDYVLALIGVVVFTLLTAYDMQKIKQLGQTMVAERETMNKVAILGALTLYLDFLNLFLSLLRIMGNRRD
jgi:FtsH-binding integral membrane protein